MDDRQLQRYSRHILLAPLDITGQQRLLAAHALVIGAGGLGSPALLYLAAAGVGRLTICDGEAVDLTNLQRQIIHRESTIGVNKAESAARTIAGINSDCQVTVVPRRVGRSDLAGLAAGADVVVDASDNLATREAINETCVALSKPLVSGAAIRFSGQVAVFDRRRPDAPCYACFLPPGAADPDQDCALMGVFAPLTGIIGTLQATEAIRILADLPIALDGEVILFDALEMHWERIPVMKDPACPVCGVGHS